ncbi:MAG: AAA family ATPase [Planctomycetota bacterium]|nr:MAG: AAA family ATPase [Planctomycetota bacterium]
MRSRTVAVCRQRGPRTAAPTAPRPQRVSAARVARETTVDVSSNSLTAAQREAVEHIDGPLLILAGPGSGKTRVVTQRIAHLVRQGVPAHQIVGLTFTNKAADEMRSRVETLIGPSRVWLGTFHRFCSRLLRRYASLVGLDENFTIYDSDDSLRMLKRTLEQMDQPPTHFMPEQIRSAISWAKNNLITPQQYEPRQGHALGSAVVRVYPEYQARMRIANAVDFDDLLLHVGTLLRENAELRAELDERYRYILVDEYQDTNLVQYAIARALSIDHPNLAVTGDPDQSIFGWRGANISNILDFQRDYPDVKVVRLEQNYRSSKQILRVADALIVHNQRRKEKRLFTENDEGSPVRLTHYATHREEAQRIADEIAVEIASGRRRPSDFAIFYRINALSRAFEFALRERGIPFQLVKGLEFYQRKEIKDVMSYLHLINNPRDDVALLRVINTPTRGIGKKTILGLTEHATRYGQTLFASAQETGLIEALGKRAATAVGRFVKIVDHLAETASAPVEEIVGRVLSESGYQKSLQESGLEEDESRLANIEELLTVAREFDERFGEEAGLSAFLEETALVNDVDQWEEEIDRVTLMTMHSAKGLEFPVVYIVAAEEGLLPHERSREDPDRLEEERRLLFVGMTRAEEELQLSLATQREFRGQRRRTVPSSFLMELPREQMKVVEPAADWTTGEFEEDEFFDGWEDDDGFDATDEEADENFDESPREFGGDREEDAEAAEAGRATARQADAKSTLTTAAQLHESREPTAATPKTKSAPPVSPEEFRVGMAVVHPEYGLGKVAALSGSATQRTATVQFVTAGERKFRLQHSALRPARET